MNLPVKLTVDDQRVVSGAAGLRRQAESLPPIESSEGYLTVARALLETRAVLKAIEQREDEILAPVKALRDTAKEWFGTAKANYEAAAEQLRARLTDYVEQRVSEAAEQSRTAAAQGDHVTALQAMQAYPVVPGLSYSAQVDFVITDDEIVPHEYRVQTYRRKEIIAALKRGESIPGVQRLDRVALTVRGATE
jgi:hypothetical protein